MILFSAGAGKRGEIRVFNNEKNCFALAKLDLVISSEIQYAEEEEVNVLDEEGTEEEKEQEAEQK